jgi:tol-pal system protein YbgF
MKHSALIVAAVLVLVGASPVAAADKAHQQLMAEIRMLQEQQQQLQQMMGTLAETLKVVSTKIDDQTAGNRKAFADEKLQIDNVADGVRVLREKADDTNVRLSTVSQELEAVRQAMSSMSTGQVPAPVTGAEPSAAGEPGGTGAAAPVPTTPPGSAPFISPQRMYDNAYSDYTGAQYDIAIQGFNAYIASFPKSDKADDAQLNIGNAYYAAGKYREAAEAFQKVIATYPNGDSVPAAYYKLGLTYTELKQPDFARRAFETVGQKYPATPEATLAKQRLDALNKK